jgi:hypothetical protein
MWVLFPMIEIPWRRARLVPGQKPATGVFLRDYSELTGPGTARHGPGERPRPEMMRVPDPRHGLRLSQRAISPEASGAARGGAGSERNRAVPQVSAAAQGRDTPGGEVSGEVGEGENRATRTSFTIPEAGRRPTPP